MLYTFCRNINYALYVCLHHLVAKLFHCFCFVFGFLGFVDIFILELREDANVIDFLYDFARICFLKVY